MRAVLLTLLFVTGGWSFSQGSYIQAKAWLAQTLISDSWEQRKYQQEPNKPWPWFDSRVVAKLELPKQNIEQFVMANSSGQSLAFGPGHLIGSAPLSTGGHSIIAGHRDTHFAFLEHTELGDVIELKHHSGRTARYRVIDLQIIDSSQQSLPEVSGGGLSLVTCYPFNAVTPGGPLRYIVVAEREPSPSTLVAAY